MKFFDSETGLVVDLNKFDSVDFRQCITDPGIWYVEANKYVKILFISDTISCKLAKFKSYETAKKLVKDISESWVDDIPAFDFRQWLKETKCLSNRHLKRASH